MTEIQKNEKREAKMAEKMKGLRKERRALRKQILSFFAPDSKMTEEQVVELYTQYCMAGFPKIRKVERLLQEPKRKTAEEQPKKRGRPSKVKTEEQETKKSTLTFEQRMARKIIKSLSKEEMALENDLVKTKAALEAVHSRIETLSLMFDLD